MTNDKENVGKKCAYIDDIWLYAEMITKNNVKTFYNFQAKINCSMPMQGLRKVDKFITSRLLV